MTKKKMFPFKREKSQQGSLFQINTAVWARAICVVPAAWHENRDVGEMGKDRKGWESVTEIGETEGANTGPD